jgi:hypothetical protein
MARIALPLLLAVVGWAFMGILPNLQSDDQPQEPRAGEAIQKSELKLPDEAKDWDSIGKFSLHSGGRDWEVRLYAYDSDSVAEKEMATKGFACMEYPNSFDLHAFYLTESGTWEHKAIYGAARIRFQRVGEVTIDNVELVFRGNFMITLEPGKKPLVNPAKLNQPFSKMLSIENGVPVLK